MQGKDIGIAVQLEDVRVRVKELGHDLLKRSCDRKIERSHEWFTRVLVAISLIDRCEKCLSENISFEEFGSMFFHIDDSDCECDPESDNYDCLPK